MDDMIQDVVDVLTWVQANIHSYNGDKVRGLISTTV